MTTTTTTTGTTGTGTTATTAATTNMPAADTIAAPHHDLVERLHAALSKRHFFIVGCQKSGTTWIQRLLDGHPALRCHGEAYFAAVLAPLLKQVQQAHNQRQKAGPLGQMTDEDLIQLFRAAAGLTMSRWLENIDDPDAIEAIGEKTPEHALCMATLDTAFPNAKFIHIIRDGRDVCVSGWFHNLRDGGDAFRQRFPEINSYIQYTLTQHWLPYIQRACAFGAANPQRYLELRYESLHTEPEAEIARMLQFLEVDDSDAAIAACAEAGAFQKLAGGRDHGQEDRGSFFRKGVVGDWRNHFDQSNIATCQQHAGDMLRALGYE